MNRLILLGNGFDLAHGMKTQYHDFIFHYIKKSFEEAELKHHYDDELLEINQNPEFARRKVSDYKELKDFLSFKKEKTSSSMIFPSTGTRGVNEHREHKDFNLKIKSIFFEHLLYNCCDYSWVNIENEYYNELKRLLDLKDDISTKLKDLNTSLACIIKMLENYLISQSSPLLINTYHTLFTAKVKKDEVVTINMHEDVAPYNTLILNFNYTSTVESYLSKDYLFDFSDTIKVNYIHGRLDDNSNPLIFGFGDEIDEDYKRMESEKRQGFLHFIKSFWYFKTSNYHHLIRFIDTEDFQVYIMGHSCGLSDRTMLNMIFEHSNCKSIKIFYYKTQEGNNYTELTQEISRHFHNKAVMRKKIVPFDQSEEMPQLK